MTGAELIGQEELIEIQELFNREKVILYRYGPKNYKTLIFEEEFAKYMGVKYAHAVSSGTAGNGYSLTRTWTRAKLLAFAQTWSSLDDAKGEPTDIGSGWTVSHTDINPSTGELNPVWGGNDTGGALQSNYGTAGI